MIGGQWFTKQLPHSKITSIIKGIKKPVVLLGGKEDIEKADAVKNELPEVINTTGKLSINQSAKTQHKVVVHIVRVHPGHDWRLSYHYK